MQAGSEERRWLERDMQACTDKIRVLHMCQALQFTNTLSKKQLAAMCVQVRCSTVRYVAVHYVRL
jgi:hypothetical protein